MARRQNDRRQVVQTIKQAAAVYKDQLVGKTFLYIFDNRYIEVIFKAANFKHLTGVDSYLSAKRFYRLAIHNQLEESQISFSSRHPFSLCQKKLGHLLDIANLASTENFMLEEITTESCSYKFGTTDLGFTLCMGEDLDPEGNKKSNCFIVQSLRNEDCFEKSKNVYTVTHIFSKRNDSKIYSEQLFKDKSVDDNELPESILQIIDMNVGKS